MDSLITSSIVEAEVQADDGVKVIPKDEVAPTGVELGIGSYGKVIEVKYDGRLCVSKEVHHWVHRLYTAKELATMKNNFLRECHLWSTLRHPNVVQFRGIYYPSSDKSVLPVMVMEKMQENVASLVDKHDNIPSLVKLSILHDVSLGLRYLHGHNPPIVHRDLSPNNILVTPHLEAKITDIGLDKALSAGDRKATPGTVVFMPPEALDDKPVYGPPLDVFSFGGVILHITSRQWPTLKSWSEINSKKQTKFSEVEQRQHYIDMICGSDVGLKSLIKSCLQDNPELRPPVADMSEKIKMMKEEFSKLTTRDGVDPISWLAEIEQPTQSLQEPPIPDLCSGAVYLKWETGSPAPVTSGKYVAQAAVLNGAVYVGGGGSKDDPHYRIDVYHPTVNKWSGTILCPHRLFAFTVHQGELAIAGGSTKDGLITNLVLVFQDGVWKKYTEMPTARTMASAVSHKSVMIVIGGNSGYTTLGTTELFDADARQWFKCDDLPEPLQFPESVIVGAKLYVLAGVTQTKELSTRVYNSSLNALSSSYKLEWQRCIDSSRHAVSAVCFRDTYLLTVGGRGRYNTVTVLKSSDSDSSSTWVSVGSLPAVQYHAAAVSFGSKIIVIGGNDYDLNMTNIVSVGTFHQTS